MNKITVVLKNRIVAKSLPEDLCILLYDACIGDNIDNALEPVSLCMPYGKEQ